MKKYLAAILIIMLILIGAKLFFNDSEQPANYVTFSENTSGEIQEALIKRLEKSKIPYRIDTNGTVKIPENDVKKAIMCCT